MAVAFAAIQTDVFLAPQWVHCLEHAHNGHGTLQIVELHALPTAPVVFVEMMDVGDLAVHVPRDRHATSVGLAGLHALPPALVAFVEMMAVVDLVVPVPRDKHATVAGLAERRALLTAPVLFVGTMDVVDLAVLVPQDRHAIVVGLAQAPLIRVLVL